MKLQQYLGIFIVLLSISGCVYGHHSDLLRKTKLESDIVLPVIGIDFGLHTLSMAYYNQGNIQIIKDQNGNEQWPSLLGFKENGDMVFGYEALDYQKEHPDRVITDINRFLGVKYDDVMLQEDLQYALFNVTEVNERPQISVSIKGEIKTFTPEQIAGYILQNLKKIAEQYLNQEVNDAVISIPSYYNNGQRIATKNAGFIAGFEFTRLFSASGSIGLNHVYDPVLSNKNNTVGFNKINRQHNYHEYDKIFAVYDIGAGSTEASLLLFKNTMINVKVPIGDTHLGGVDIERQILDEKIKNITQENGDQNFTKAQRQELQKEINQKLKNNELNQIHLSQNKEVLALEEKIIFQLENLIIKSKNDYPYIDEILIRGNVYNREFIKQIINMKFEGFNIRFIGDDQDVAKGCAIMGQQIYNKRPQKEQEQQQQKENEQAKQQEQVKQQQQQEKQENQEDNKEQKVQMLGGNESQVKKDL